MSETLQKVQKTKNMMGPWKEEVNEEMALKDGLWELRDLFT